MENQNTYESKFLVTRIGNGAKLHLSLDYNGGRLYPMCGLDSPFSKARPAGRPLAEITCKHCRESAIKRKLI
jgi:hypothetical protein